MGQRPSQCIECGCFSHCLSPNSPDCAERREISTKEGNLVPFKAPQQFSTPDGSVWEHHALSGGFIRVDSPDGSHEDDAHGQSLDKVIRSWGPLSLHDPVAKPAAILFKAARASSIDVSLAQLRGMASNLRGDGWELRRIDD
jgi:hypothetical protein